MEIIHDFFKLFFPKTCVACSEGLAKGEGWLCSACIAQLPFTHHTADEQNVASIKLRNRLPLGRAMALLYFRKKGLTQHVLHALKYKGNQEVGISLGKLIGHEILQAKWAMPEIIVPIPLHKSKLRVRGYNQSSLIAQGIAQVLKIPVDETISYRKAKTQTQTKKGLLDRWKNVEHVFDIPKKINAKHILLVDDVITTGATLEACGEALTKAGVEKISVACAAMPVK